MENLKDKLIEIFLCVLRKICEIAYFVYDIIRHPIKNISIYIIIFIAWNIYENKICINGIGMLGLAAAGVSILTIAISLFEKQTIDKGDKENFYLGYNIKKLSFYENFFFKKFSYLPIRLVLWLIVLLPIYVIMIEKKIVVNFFDYSLFYVEGNTKLLTSIWFSVYSVTAVHFFGLIISYISLIVDKFFGTYFYRETNLYEKTKIEQYLGKQYREVFRKLFSFKNIVSLDNRFETESEEVINYIINRAKKVRKEEDELRKYLELAFDNEREQIDKIIKLVKKLEKYTKDNGIQYEISSSLIKEMLEKIKLYYSIKWCCICKLDISSTQLIELACVDLNRLLEIEKSFRKNKCYKEEFYGKYIKRKNRFLFKEGEIESNLCIEKLVDTITEKFSKIDYLNELHDNMQKLFKIFYVLKKIDELLEESHYFQDVFEVLYLHTQNKNNTDEKFVIDFLEKLKKTKESYIIFEIEKIDKESKDLE